MKRRRTSFRSLAGCLNAEGTLGSVLLGPTARCGAVRGGCVHGESTVMVVIVSMCESIMMGCMPASTRPEFRRMPEAATWSYTGHRLATATPELRPSVPTSSQPAGLLAYTRCPPKPCTHGPAATHRTHGTNRPGAHGAVHLAATPVPPGAQSTVRRAGPPVRPGAYRAARLPGTWLRPRT